MKSKSKTFKSASIAILILAIIYALALYFSQSIVTKNKVCHKNWCFLVEIADSDQERQEWLMYRESIGEDRWMIFVFQEEKKHSFWMKNTLIPLDIIRINSNNKIVDIQTAQPCDTKICSTYIPAWDASYVLEINSWLAKKENIEVWDTLELKLK